MRRTFIFVLMPGLLFSHGIAMGKVQLIPAEKDGWQRKDVIVTYDRNSLFDYIDGAAELYLSYDFQNLSVHHLVKPEKSDIIVELYQMGSSEDAFGIFSHDQEGGDVGIGQGSEYGSGWLRFWKGSFFVSVFAEEETAEAAAAILGIGKAIAAGIDPPGKEPGLLAYIPRDGLKHTLYFHKHEILNHHYFLANQNILMLGEDTEAILARYEAFPGEPSHRKRVSFLLLVKYPNVQQAEVAFESFLGAYMPEAGKKGIVKTENDLWSAGVRAQDFVIVIFDAATKTWAEDLIQQVKTNLQTIMR
jgi:hypothetical protein